METEASKNLIEHNLKYRVEHEVSNVRESGTDAVNLPVKDNHCIATDTV